MVRIFFFLVCILILFTGCYSSRDLSTHNLNSLYRKSEQVLHADFSLFHRTDSLSQLHIQIRPGEFLFVRQEDNNYQANIKVTIYKTWSYEANTPLDTFICDFAFGMDDKSKVKILNCEFEHSGTGNFLLRILIQDINKNFQQEFFLPMDNEGKQARQHFLVKDSIGAIMFKTHLKSDEPVFIAYRDSAVKGLWCKYYNRDFPLAAPPFSFDTRQGFNYKSDSLFYVQLDSSGLKFPAEGFYHFQLDTTTRDGLTLYRFDNSFPQVNTPAQMLQSVRYLTSKREYDEMKSNPSTRQAIDKFWIDRGGNAEKSRLLIRKYYSRVQEANEFFSSFVEGWRTDRGMLYIIFGAPNTVYRSSSTETWIYGTPNSTLALNFMFTRVNNPFSDNDLVLSRSPVYESNWYRAVETWRHGRAYNSVY